MSTDNGLLLIGSQLGDMSYLVCKETDGNVIAVANNDPNWWDPCAYVFDHPEVFKDFGSISEAMKWAEEQGLVLTEEIEFVLY